MLENNLRALMGMAAAGAVVTLLFTFSATAAAQTGGSETPGSGTPVAPATPVTTPTPTGPLGKATLLPNGTAVPPADAPPAVVGAINAANQIRLTPYRWGGGHKSFYNQAGYDCSGAVSYALRGAGLLASPLPSGPLMKWGLPGRGSWISVYANAGHTYAVIAGLRWDTSAMGSGSGKGPRWRSTQRPARGYAVRHYLGL